MKKAFTLVALASLSLAAFAEFKKVIDIPVASVTNRMYLADSESRPWWNSAWRKRAPILVSNVADVRVQKAMIDFVFDVGEKVNPDEVRVVTPWEVVVPCVAEKADGENRIEVIFETSLRERENRPFFVYWDNPGAKGAPVFSPISLLASDSELRVNNGAVDVTFDNLHRTAGLIRDLRVNASPAPTELMWRTTAYAYEGFSFLVGGQPMGWSKAQVVTDNPLKKVIRFVSPKADLDFTFYAGLSRVDYAYRLKGGNLGGSIALSWAPGGGTGFDDFYYGGLAGKTVTFPASLDEISDSLPSPRYYGFPWLASDWYALRDRRTGDVVGQVFDRAANNSVWYLGIGPADGEQVRLGFNHRPVKGEAASGRGAIVAGIGDIDLVRHTAALLKNPPKVFVAAVQPWREIPVKVPSLQHDFCVNINVGGWCSSTPLEGTEWITNIVSHVRERGANSVLLGQLIDYKWTDLPVPKSLYDRIAERYKPKFEAKKLKFPEWKEGAFTGEKLKLFCRTAHDLGMVVSTWHTALGGLGVGGKSAFDPIDNKFNCAIESLYAKCGIDSSFNEFGVGEGNPLPADVVKTHGRNYWEWKDPSLHFKLRREIAAEMKKFYDFAHKANPDTTVMAFHSDNPELMRDMSMPWLVGTLDTYFCEFVSGFNFSKVKHTAKRQRAFFDNEPGRTIFAHYYHMKTDPSERICQTEMPFICGINGFSQEAMTYENVDPENLQIAADFNRFAQYTRLGAKAAKMAPVKNLAVLRDMDCFVEDILKRRTFKRSWWQASRHDARVNAFAELYNFNYDVVFNAFFNAKSLARYNVVYIPDDEVFSDELAKELLAYVKNGGGAVLEGATGESCKTLKALDLKDGVVRTLGKGRIVWTKEVPTDKMMNRNQKAMDDVLALLKSVGSRSPYEIAGSKTLDGTLQSSSEGLFLGLHNRNPSAADCGCVTIDTQTLKQLKHSDNLYVLDVKKGIRFPYRDGFEVEIGPHQCGFYLIGDESFTAVPAAKEAAWCGSEIASVGPNGKAPEMLVGETFTPHVAVELVKPGARIDRSEKLLLDVRRFTKDDIGALVRQLPTADYLHIKVEASDSDALFAEHADALKEFLRRGGGILFDGVLTGPRARRFLADAGVKDPTPNLKTGIGDGSGKMLETLADDCLIKRHPTPGLFNKNLGYDRVFTEWDKATQIAPYVARLAPESAIVVAQDKVLGKGKVIFSQCKSAFTDFYENDGLGNALISYLIGEFAEDYMKKASRAIGGPGRIFDEKKLERR